MRQNSISAGGYDTCEENGAFSAKNGGNSRLSPVASNLQSQTDLNSHFFTDEEEASSNRSGNNEGKKSPKTLKPPKIFHTNSHTSSGTGNSGDVSVVTEADRKTADQIQNLLLLDSSKAEEIVASQENTPSFGDQEIAFGNMLGSDSRFSSGVFLQKNNSSGDNIISGAGNRKSVQEKRNNASIIREHERTTDPCMLSELEKNVFVKNNMGQASSFAGKVQPQVFPAKKIILPGKNSDSNFISDASDIETEFLKDLKIPGSCETADLIRATARTDHGGIDGEIALNIGTNSMGANSTIKKPLIEVVDVASWRAESGSVISPKPSAADFQKHEVLPEPPKLAAFKTGAAKLPDQNEPSSSSSGPAPSLKTQLLNQRKYLLEQNAKQPQKLQKSLDAEIAKKTSSFKNLNFNSKNGTGSTNSKTMLELCKVVQDINPKISVTAAKDETENDCFFEAMTNSHQTFKSAIQTPQLVPENAPKNMGQKMSDKFVDIEFSSSAEENIELKTDSRKLKREFVLLSEPKITGKKNLSARSSDEGVSFRNLNAEMSSSSLRIIDVEKESARRQKKSAEKNSKKQTKQPPPRLSPNPATVATSDSPFRISETDSASDKVIMRISGKQVRKPENNNGKSFISAPVSDKNKSLIDSFATFHTEKGMSNDRQSAASTEIVREIQDLKEKDVRVVRLTGDSDSTIGKKIDISRHSSFQFLKNQQQNEISLENVKLPGSSFQSSSTKNDQPLVSVVAEESFETAPAKNKSMNQGKSSQKAVLANNTSLQSLEADTDARKKSTSKKLPSHIMGEENQTKKSYDSNDPINIRLSNADRSKSERVSKASDMNENTAKNKPQLESIYLSSPTNKKSEKRRQFVLKTDKNIPVSEKKKSETLLTEAVQKPSEKVSKPESDSPVKFVMHDDILDTDFEKKTSEVNVHMPANNKNAPLVPLKLSTEPTNKKNETLRIIPEDTSFHMTTPSPTNPNDTLLLCDESPKSPRILLTKPGKNEEPKPLLAQLANDRSSAESLETNKKSRPNSIASSQFYHEPHYIKESSYKDNDKISMGLNSRTSENVVNSHIQKNLIATNSGNSGGNNNALPVDPSDQISHASSVMSMATGGCIVEQSFLTETESKCGESSSKIGGVLSTDSSMFGTKSTENVISPVEVVAENVIIQPKNDVVFINSPTPLTPTAEKTAEKFEIVSSQHSSGSSSFDDRLMFGFNSPLGNASRKDEKPKFSKKFSPPQQKATTKNTQQHTTYAVPPPNADNSFSSPSLAGKVEKMSKTPQKANNTFEVSDVSEILYQPEQPSADSDGIAAKIVEDVRITEKKTEKKIEKEQPSVAKRTEKPILPINISTTSTDDALMLRPDKDSQDDIKFNTKKLILAKRTDSFEESIRSENASPRPSQFRLSERVQMQNGTKQVIGLEPTFLHQHESFSDETTPKRISYVEKRVSALEDRNSTKHGATTTAAANIGSIPDPKTSNASTVLTHAELQDARTKMLGEIDSVIHQFEQKAMDFADKLPSPKRDKNAKNNENLLRISAQKSPEKKRVSSSSRKNEKTVKTSPKKIRSDSSSSDSEDQRRKSKKKRKRSSNKKQEVKKRIADQRNKKNTKVSEDEWSKHLTSNLLAQT